MSVTTTTNSPPQDYTHPDDHTPLPHVTLGLKPFAEIIYVIFNINNLKIFTLKKVKLLSFNYLIGIM